MIIPRRLLTTAVLAALFCCASIHGGGVQKIDDTTINGEIIGFDGSSIIVESKDADGKHTRSSIAIEDVMQVRFAEGATPSTTRSTAAPAKSDIAPASQPMVPPTRKAVAGLLRMVGLKPIDESDGDAVPATASTSPSTRSTTLPTTWRARLVSDDAVRGTLTAWTTERISLQHESTKQPLEIPTDRVAEFWHAPPELEQKARALAVEPKAGEDIAYVMNEANVVAVTGIALQVDGDSLSFRHDGQDRRISLVRLVGLVMGAAKSKTPAPGSGAFHQVLRFGVGDVLCGRWMSLNDGSIVLKTLWDQTIDIPVAAVTSLDCRNGRVVYLSDLKPSKVDQTPYFDRVIPWRADASASGGALVLLDGQYARGIWMHSRCVLQFDLSAGYERFRARLGFEQPGGAIGRAAVSVVADDKHLFDDADARGDRQPVDLDLDVNGAQTLVISVDFGRDQDAGDRVIWANARLVRSHVGR